MTADAPPTLLLVDQYGWIGGGQRIALDLVDAATESGWQVHALVPDGPYGSLLEEKGAHVHHWQLPEMRSGRKSPWEYLVAHIRIQREARKFLPLVARCDLVVINGLRALPAAKLWQGKTKVPTALYLHGIYHGLQRSLIAAFLRRPRTAAIAPSPVVAAPFGRTANVHEIPNWVSPEFLTDPSDRTTLRRELRIVDQLPIILVPGRFSETKGQTEVLEALRTMREPCHVVFAGAALFEQSASSIQEMIDRAASEDSRIHRIRWAASLTGLFDGSDAVLVPSVWEEPFGLTAIEAMARKVPVILSSRGALPWIADNDRNATVITPNARSIADVLQRFLKNPNDFAGKTQTAYAAVQTRFNPAANRRRVLDVLTALLQ